MTSSGTDNLDFSVLRVPDPVEQHVADQSVGFSERSTAEHDEVLGAPGRVQELLDGSGLRVPERRAPEDETGQPVPLSVEQALD